MYRKNLLFLMLLFSVEVFAANDCLRDLPIDSKIITSDLKSRISLLKTFDSKMFQESKRTGTFDGLFAGFGAFADVGFDYSKFNTVRNEVLSKHEYTEDVDHAWSYVERTVANNSKEIALACLRQRSASEGIVLFLKSVTDDTAIVELHLNSPTTVNEVNLSLVSLEGSNTKREVITNQIATLKADGFKILSLKRDKNKDVILVVETVGAWSVADSILISRDPKVKEVVINKPVQVCHGVTECRQAIGSPYAVSGSSSHPWFHKIGIPREPHSATNPETNADQICKQSLGKSYHSHKTTQHRINCGHDYTMAEWQSNRWDYRNFGTCKAGYATVINQVMCK